MSKYCGMIVGLLFWGAGSLLAADRAGAVAEMQKNIAELGAILEAQGVVFQAEALAPRVMDAAIRAIDPGACLVTPGQAEQFQEEEKGGWYDIGVKLTLKNKLLKIAEVSTNGAAAAAGVPAGAIIEKIDDQPAAGMALDQAENLLRGRKNEPVTLTVRPDDKDAEARTFQLTRAGIRIPPLGITELWPQQIGYLKINGLYEATGAQVAAQLNAWSGTNCAGMIIDLRNSNGMNLDAVAEIAGLFSPSAPLLFTVKDGFDKPLKTYTAPTNDKPIDRPVMVLVNRDTRGAAETLAAVLQDCRGVMIIGAPTRGDNFLRAPLPVANGKVLYIAIKRIDMGKKDYNGKGVKPDVIVNRTEAKAGAPDAVEEDNGLFSGLSEQEQQARALATRIGDDLILMRATDILLGLKALDSHTP